MPNAVHVRHDRIQYGDVKLYAEQVVRNWLQILQDIYGCRFVNAM